ncbi:50S ribosomal protein L18 [Candidatus Roizmanbacteria bacterium RIFCSPHIGHO2_02_FULL_40_9]|uniref:Large ribosomal subunit protein uL18 n=2 Tax=Candidatus Roizmaniibacteriota TaxID=1752723 RepID=A0A1F7IKZ7_9BACT|nr:MAG: 50S ribosomal protein L18 [Candidatus Roizmanbacteria bacterium RIFCSPHIGHO2_02_FULL_40_9]OGK44021.1 MAG: 50S ribosomal protein L18 [Candidatus Roizmanbacteria bacterium RIFCSPLOWO2_01_FULL_38_11]
MKNKTLLKHSRRQKRVRAKILGKTELPRMTVYRSNKHVYVQVIDDKKSHTIASSSDVVVKGTKMTNIEKATKVGEDIAKKLQEKKIKQVVFDRSGYAYGGRVKALAEAARSAGIII